MGIVRMRGPVQDMRVEAVMPGVEMVVRTPTVVTPEAPAWAVFVGDYEWVPWKVKDIQFTVGLQGATVIYVRYERGDVILGSPPGTLLLRKGSRFAFMRHTPGLITGLGTSTAGSTTQSWEGPMAAVLLDHEPSDYQTARLVQTLARML